MKKTKKISLLSFFVLLALSFAYIESMLPPPFPVPGAKIGLSNIIPLFMLFFYKNNYFFRFSEILLVVITRILLYSLIFGTFMSVSFLLSFTAGLGAFLIEYCIFKIIIKTPQKISIVVVSIIGGVFHNIIQIATASLIIIKSAVLYLPYAAFCGLFAGAFSAFCAGFLLAIIRKIRS